MRSSLPQWSHFARRWAPIVALLTFYVHRQAIWVRALFWSVWHFVLICDVSYHMSHDPLVSNSKSKVELGVDKIFEKSILSIILIPSGYREWSRLEQRFVFLA